MRRPVSLAAALSISLVAAFAVAQGLPQRPQPGLPGQPQQFPPNHPPLQGQTAPGQRPIQLGPDGRPMRNGPQRPPRPGMPPMPPSRPHPPAHAEAAESELGPEEHECPGHGPDDRPLPVNLWRGLLMVDNERALQPGIINQILFRYEDPKKPCDPRNQPAPYLAGLLNFAMMALIIYRFGRKPIAEALLTRKKTIMADIDTATRLKEDAEARLDDYEHKLDNLEATIEEVRLDFAMQADVEKTHVLADAEERRIRMRRDAELRVEQERKAMRDQLLYEAVVAATAAAEALIAKQMSGADQDRMASAYLASVGAALEKAQATS